MRGKCSCKAAIRPSDTVVLPSFWRVAAMKTRGVSVFTSIVILIAILLLIYLVITVRIKGKIKNGVIRRADAHPRPDKVFGNQWPERRRWRRHRGCRARWNRAKRD